MLAKDYQDMIHELDQHKVEFVLIGAYAMSIFGYTRATGDIDFFIKPTHYCPTKVRGFISNSLCHKGFLCGTML